MAVTAPRFWRWRECKARIRQEHHAIDASAINRDKTIWVVAVPESCAGCAAGANVMPLAQLSQKRSDRAQINVGRRQAVAVITSTYTRVVAHWRRGVQRVVAVAQRVLAAPENKPRVAATEPSGKVVPTRVAVVPRVQTMQELVSEVFRLGVGKQLVAGQSSERACNSGKCKIVFVGRIFGSHCTSVVREAGGVYRGHWVAAKSQDIHVEFWIGDDVAPEGPYAGE